MPLALAGGCGAITARLLDGQLSPGWLAAIYIPSLTALLFGVPMGLMALFSARGEARLRRGIGVLARWTMPPADWEAFRSFDARRACEGRGLDNDYAPRPAEGRDVGIVIGRRQVIVDGSYHPLSRFALPELTWVGWQQPPDAPECLEFGVLYPGGRYGGAKPATVRVPVSRAAREDAVRVFHHFKASVPTAQAGLAFRRPRLVLGGGLLVTGLGAALAAATWMLGGGAALGEAGVFGMAAGIGIAIGGALVTLVLALVIGLSRRQSTSPKRTASS